MKTIVITGASRGIGAAIAMRLADVGVELCLQARTEEALKEVASVCTEKGAVVHLQAVDLADGQSVSDWGVKLAQRFRQIDVVIHNAGMWLEAPITSAPESIWDQALEVNLLAPMKLTQKLIHNIPSGGAIICIGSAASKRTYAGGTNYCAAKFGILGFSGALFEDVRARGIKVSTILPGVVNTDMHSHEEQWDFQKMIQPHDVANCVQFILSAPSNVCPTQIHLEPQFYPKRSAR